ncbi:MAG TPA: glutathione S-transferase N-terminal domain-containing protein [Xanthobacteraceae bacterium]
MAITFYDLVDKNGRRYSPYGWRVRMALAHKGLDAAVELCWHSDKRKLAFSGQHLVPVLRDGGKAVNDSWNIACYLDEAYPDRPGLMEGSQGRSFARFLNSWMDSIIGRPLVRSLYLDILRSMHPQADAQEFRQRREERSGATLETLHANRAADFVEVNRALLPLNQLLRGQPFVGGAAPAYVDYIVLGTLQMPRVLGIEPLEAQQDGIIRWREGMRKLFNGLAERTS